MKNLLMILILAITVACNDSGGGGAVGEAGTPVSTQSASTISVETTFENAAPETLTEEQISSFDLEGAGIVVFKFKVEIQVETFEDGSEIRTELSRQQIGHLIVVEDDVPNGIRTTEWTSNYETSESSLNRTVSCDTGYRGTEDKLCEIIPVVCSDPATFKDEATNTCVVIAEESRQVISVNESTIVETVGNTTTETTTKVTVTQINYNDGSSEEISLTAVTNKVTVVEGIANGTKITISINNVIQSTSISCDANYVVSGLTCALTMTSTSIQPGTPVINVETVVVGAVETSFGERTTITTTTTIPNTLITSWSNGTQTTSSVAPTVSSTVQETIVNRTAILNGYSFLTVVKVDGAQVSSTTTIECVGAIEEAGACTVVITEVNETISWVSTLPVVESTRINADGDTELISTSETHTTVAIETVYSSGVTSVVDRLDVTQTVTILKTTVVEDIELDYGSLETTTVTTHADGSEVITNALTCDEGYTKETKTVQIVLRS